MEESNYMPDYVSSWIQVIIEAPESQADAAADFLVGLTGAGVETDDSPERPGCQRVIGYLDESGDVEGLKTAIQGFVDSLACDGGGATVRFEHLAGQDWGENWKQNFEPRAVTKTLVIAPPWHPVTPHPDQDLIIIDPGQAFGTGQHETTMICLQRMESLGDNGRLGPEVLDVGCGSGILAMAAVKFGATSALGIDIDPEAVRATMDNAALNGLEERIRAEATLLQDVPGTFGAVLANLTGKDLLELAEPLRAKVAKGGYLICSGMLVHQVPAVQAAFEGLGLHLLEYDMIAGWAGLVMT